MKKTVIITGATDGIGKALARLLSSDYNLALCGRSEDKMNQLTQNASILQTATAATVSANM